MLNTRVFLQKLAAFSVGSIVLLAGVSASTQSQTVVQGHVTWTDLRGFDECMAGIAGLARSQVLWFNDQVLVDNYDLGDKWIYVTETGAPDPEEFVLAHSRNITFDDPNGVWWNVTEWQYFAGASAHGTKAPQHHTGSGWPVPSVSVEGREHARAGPYYAWTVQILPKPVMDENPGWSIDHQDYNFVVVVDTCKFLRGYDHVVDWDPEEGDPNNPSEFPPRDAHKHRTFSADIRLGEAPDGGGVYIPVGQPGASYEQQGSNDGETYSPLTP